MDAATRTAAKPSLNLKRILVPIDFSDCSKKALQYALPLAQEHRAALTLLYVVSPAYGGAEFGALNYVELVADEGRSDLVMDALVRVGSPALEIIATARSLRADLIVISTHGRTGLKHVFLGSVTEGVVQCAPSPVFVVRECEHEILAA